MKRLHVQEAASLIVSQLPLEQCRVLPFKNGIPGRKWLKNFSDRHKRKLKFSHPLKQEGKRFVSVNSESLTTHLSLLEELVKGYSLDAELV